MYHRLGKKRGREIMWLDWLENVPLEIECKYCGRRY